ncbi:DUF4345 domain-containing protein [Flammeovirga sp. SubArs3]|uniref:DUF4345 domain-containing protein n=1 Tax=Flammeovirga sp. SubArs3 TaxID=2995316 RepID=UPI00248C649F|nr:DUF4345 domain-containing protein [Flammeovirga sp. SubArs3]
MNISKSSSILLFLSGIIGLYVGGSLVFFPEWLQVQSGIFLDNNPSHFSETRAPGTAILSASIFILVAVFKNEYRKLALGLTTLFFLSYGLGRLLSLFLDGMPAEGLFYAMIGEIAIGLSALILWKKSENFQIKS